jgi:biopolymer transport protein ExbD
MYDIVTHHKKRDATDLNVVPILDMLVSLIFFLLLTTAFLHFTKDSVPPSSVSTITDPVVPPPVAARLVCVEDGEKTKLFLSWAGANPGQAIKEITGNPMDSKEETNAVLQGTTDILAAFQAQYPNEKTLQIGLGANVPYQKLIAIMDGAKEKMPDIVLFDYQEAQTRADAIKQ